MIAFLTEIVSDWRLSIASLGVLLLLYVCKRLIGKIYKRRINDMLPNELQGNPHVENEVSDVVKELEELSFTLAKYGYRLTFDVSITKVDSNQVIRTLVNDEQNLSGGEHEI